MDPVRFVLDLYNTRAQGRYGLSAVNQQQHALQAATMAEQDGASPQRIVAALLHDVGHMIHALGEEPAANGVDDAHEKLAAAWLGEFFCPEVVEPVRLHVEAKRYLCATESSYAGKLGRDSVRSLALQGGPMTAVETTRFECLPFHQEAIRLRRIDDQAKNPTAVTMPVEHFLQYLELTLLSRGENPR